MAERINTLVARCCPKSYYHVIAKEERLMQSLDFKGFQNRLLRSRSQEQLKIELFGQPRTLIIFIRVNLFNLRNLWRVEGHLHCSIINCSLDYLQVFRRFIPLFLIEFYHI